MLLLVLILVVIAFGLLVVALLSTSVLWAWVSVGVSVVAAVVLLVDWLQRRSAAKAGAMPAVEQATGAAAPLAAPESGSARSAMAAPPRGDLDPPTEVLPIVPSPTRGGSEPDSPTVMTPAPQQFDAQQTVVMPAVQPSGSPVRPSGADPSLTPSSVISSPTVTETEVDRSVPGFGTGDQTVAVEPASTPGAAPTGTEPMGADEAGAAVSSEVEGPDTEVASPPEAPAEVGPGTAAAGGVTASAIGVALTKSGDVDPTADQPTSDQPTAENATPVAGAVVPAAAGPGAPEPASTTTGPDAESTIAVEAHPSAPVERVEPEAPVSAADVAPVDATRANAVSAPAEQVDLFAAPVAADVEPASSGEAPEAPHDPVAAEIVRGLDDEVVVVDEQPRYHVSECRALVSVAVIPLPVREAVELGFTPCGWCSPERTLAGRHQTASR